MPYRLPLRRTQRVRRLLELFRYGMQGVFIRQNELIDAYGVNLKKLLERFHSRR